MSETENLYETNRLLAEYLLFHFGKQEELLPWAFGPTTALNFPTRTASHFSEGKVTRSLDLGCSVGGSSFVLNQSSEEVIGIDFSQNFIDAANDLNQGKVINYEVLEEAGQMKSLETSVTEKGTGNLSFEQGDAMNLRPDIGQFDRVHAANLLCRLPNPNLLLERLPELIKPNGELLLATPCTWLEEFTKKEYFPESTTLEWLKQSLSNDFELIKQTDEPFLIREHARKYQWTVSMLTLWRRKA